MQQTTVTAVPVQTVPAVIDTAPPLQLNITGIRGLGITQIVFGVLSVIFGIVTSSAISGYWVNNSGSGIWFGLWITVTGIIGVCSARQPGSKALNGTNMGFNIVCTVVSFFVGIFFIIAVGHFNKCAKYWQRYNYSIYSCGNKSAGIAIYAILLILMFAEFFVSLIISVYCCQGSGCCGGQTTGVIIQQQHPAAYQVTTSSTGQTFITPGPVYPPPSYPQVSCPQALYPQASYPQASYPQALYPQASYAASAYPNQPVMQPLMGAYITPTYSTDQIVDLPPPYSQ